MTTITITSDGANDGGLEAFEDSDEAAIRSRTSGDYDYTSFAAFAGWYNSGGFFCDQIGLTFDTSSIPVDATITSVTLHVWMTGAGSSGSDIQARAGFSWSGHPALSDWRTPAQFAALTLVATKPFATDPLADIAFTSEAAFLDAINKGGLTQLWLVDAAWAADAVTPNDGYTQVNLGDNTGEEPYLVIEYTSGVPDEIVGDASITLADATLSAAGALAITGSASITLMGTTLSAEGALALFGTAAITLGDVTLAATGALEGTEPEAAAITPDLPPRRRRDHIADRRRKMQAALDAALTAIYGEEVDEQPPAPFVAAIEEAREALAAMPLATVDVGAVETAAREAAAMAKARAALAQLHAWAQAEAEDEEEAAMLLLAA